MKAIMLILLLPPIVLLLLDRYTNFDLMLADAMFDSSVGNFPWRNNWLADTFAHRWLKLALVLLGVLVVGTAIFDAVRPIDKWGHAFRIRVRLLAVSAALIPLVIGTAKRFSAIHCPWDIERYGGLAPYIKLLDSMPLNIAPGHCFPAGHISSALWLLAITLFWLPHHPRTAGVVGFLVLAFGFALGWLQQLRGAHFLSHTLWSMWIACCLVALLYFVFIVVPQAREQAGSN